MLKSVGLEAGAPAVEDRIAIVGAGIAGLGSAWLLQRQGHAVTLFEANGYLGGHTATVDVALEGMRFPVDTGFLVFNDRTYPRLVGSLPSWAWRAWRARCRSRVAWIARDSNGRAPA